MSHPNHQSCGPQNPLLKFSSLAPSQAQSTALGKRSSPGHPALILLLLSHSRNESDSTKACSGAFFFLSQFCSVCFASISRALGSSLAKLAHWHCEAAVGSVQVLQAHSTQVQESPEGRPKVNLSLSAHLQVSMILVLGQSHSFPSLLVQDLIAMPKSTAQKGKMSLFRPLYVLHNSLAYL